MNYASQSLQDISNIDEQIVALSMSKESGQSQYFNFAYLINKLSICIEKAENSGIEKNSLKSAIKRSREIFSSSYYVRRIQEWPRGYQGDFETVEHLSIGIEKCELEDLSSCIEYYSQMLPITQQHRNKLIHQERLAKQAILSNHNILSVGCGGAIDINHALEGIHDYAGSISFIDMDQDALDLVSARTNDYDFTVSNKNIVRGVGQEKNGFYHLILCGGLFDYLEERIAGMLLRQLKRKLTSDGVIFLTNIAKGNPFRIQMEYMCDWELIERTEEEIEALVQKYIGTSFSVSSTRDSTGLAILSSISAS